MKIQVLLAKDTLYNVKKTGDLTRLNYLPLSWHIARHLYRATGFDRCMFGLNLLLVNRQGSIPVTVFTIQGFPNSYDFSAMIDGHEIKEALISKGWTEIIKTLFDEFDKLNYRFYIEPYIMEKKDMIIPKLIL